MTPDVPHNPSSSHAVRRWSRRRRVGVALCIAVAVVLFIRAGSRRAAHGPDSGQRLRPTTSSSTGDPPLHAPPGRRFRVATFNIHRAKGTDGRRDLTRTADTLRLAQAHLIGLNEVHGQRIWTATSQAQQLGEMLHMAWLYAPTEQRWWHVEFGNALLSSLPIVHWQKIPLVRGNGKSHRNVVLAIVEHLGRRIHLLVTHIDRSNDQARQMQLRTVSQLFLSLEEPAILMGDMNTPPEDPLMRQLLDNPEISEPLRAKHGDEAPRTIDWILVRGLRCVDAGMVNNGASDHPMLWAELELPLPSANVPSNPSTVSTTSSAAAPLTSADSAHHPPRHRLSHTAPPPHPSSASSR